MISPCIFFRMACAVATPVLEPSGDFPAWLEAQGVNAEVARAMHSELGIRDYGVLRACVGDGLVRAELLATARDRLPFGFYAVLRQVVKALQGTEPHDAGIPRWDDAASFPSDVSLGGLVEVLLALFSGLSRELLLSVQRLDEIDNPKYVVASSLPSAPRPEDGTLELDHDEPDLRSIPAMDETKPNNSVVQIKMEPLEDEREERLTPTMDDTKPNIAVVQIKTELLEEGACLLNGCPELIVQKAKTPPDLRTNLARTAAAHPFAWPQPNGIITDGEPGERTSPTMDDTISNFASVHIEMEPLDGECHMDGRPEIVHRTTSPPDLKRNLVHTAAARTYAWPKPDAEMHGEEIAVIPSSQTLTQQQQLAFAQRETIVNAVSTNNSAMSSVLEDETFKFNLKVTQPEVAAEKRHRCELCGKTYSLAFNLKRHTYVHTGAWPCRCKVCGHGVLRASDLKEHMRVHTGERPFCCNACGQCFTRAWHLRSHERTHTGEKPHRCGLCGKEFTRSNGLRLHQRKHAGDKK
ncbi:uncharacterized protein LOC144717288 isoform X1 [Lampetra planeri]